VLRLVRAEFLKLRTTQVWFWLLLGALALSALVAIGSLASTNGVRTEVDVRDLFANANGALISVFVLGVLGVTTEYRHQTITPTMLATPSRWAVVSAKLITYALVGIAYSVLCIGLQLAIAVPWLSSKGIDYSLTDPLIRRALLGLLAIFALFAVIGLGVGALLRNQIVAVTVGLIFLLVLQNLIGAIPKVKNAWPYTPAGGITGMLYTGGAARFNDIQAFGVPGSVTVLLVWAAVPAAIGAAFSMSRDIT
jgi:ABC-2 type transport system permease protein